jgi:two-component system sensor histidine kinase UhpB
MAPATNHRSFAKGKGTNTNLFATVTRLACDLLRAERASLLLPEKDSRTLYIVAAKGIPASIVAETRIRRGESIAWLVAQRREALVVSAPKAIHPDVYRTGSYISVPVQLDRRHVGVLNVSDPIGRDAFTDRDLATLLDLAALVAHNLSGSISQRELQREIVAAREDERQRIARELHDEAGHTLTAAIIQLDRDTRDSFTDPEKARSAVERAGTTLLETAVLIHDIAYSLYPRILEDLGLEAALRSICSRARALGLPATLTLTGLAQRLTSEVELAVFRVVQEALTNVQKHARATQAWVDLHFTADSLTITIEDDGVGFSHDASPAPHKQGGLGLKGMNDRIAPLGGTCTVEQRSGQGVRVVASLPLSPPAR